MKEITKYLKEAGCFFLGTEDGDQPELRPIGIVEEYDGKLYMAIGRHKNVFKQILANPKVVIVAMKEGGSWVRVRAKAIDSAQEIADRILEDNAGLKAIYNEETGLKLGALELTEGEAEFCGMMGPERTEKF